jgi:hypothetical protein
VAAVEQNPRSDDSKEVRPSCKYAVLLFVTTLAAGPTATFSVDGVASVAHTAVATVQPRNGAPGLSWLRIYFYPSPLNASDASDAAAGRVDSIKAKWNAVVQLTMGRDGKIWQADLSLPGHTCTIAESDRDANKALQEFQFDGTHLRLKATGSHVCDMKFMGIPNQTFTWAVDLRSTVVVARQSPH